MAKKLFFFLLVFLFCSLFVSAQELGENQNQAWNILSNSEATDQVNLGLTDSGVAQLLQAKKDDDNYGTAIGKISRDDLARAIKDDPSLVDVGDSALMGRLNSEIASNDGNWINSIGNKKVKDAWLSENGFKTEDRSAFDWSGVDIVNYDDKTGMLELKAKGGPTRVNMTQISEACASVGDGSSCVTLTNDGHLRTANGIELSRGNFEVVVGGDGQLSYVVKKQGNNAPIIDLKEDSYDSEKGAVGIKIVDAKGVQIMRGGQLVATDSSFQVNTLGSGALKISEIDSNGVQLNHNVKGWVTGNRKIAEISSGSVDYDFQSGIMQFREQSNVKTYSANGEMLFSSNLPSGTTLTTGTRDNLKLGKGVGMTLEDVSDHNLLVMQEVRENLVRDRAVYVRANGQSNLVLDNFNNGVALYGDVSTSGGKVVQNVAWAKITMENDKGLSYTGSIANFQGVTQAEYGSAPGQLSRYAFDNGYIFGIGKNTVRLENVGTYTTWFGLGKEVRSDEWDLVSSVDSVSPTVTTRPVSAPATPPVAIERANAQANARATGLETNIRRKTSGDTKDWVGAVALFERLANMFPNRAKEKCSNFDKDNCPVRDEICKVDGENCVSV